MESTVHAISAVSALSENRQNLLRANALRQHDHRRLFSCRRARWMGFSPTRSAGDGNQFYFNLRIQMLLQLSRISFPGQAIVGSSEVQRPASSSPPAVAEQLRTTRRPPKVLKLEQFSYLEGRRTVPENYA
jgi:hypothetical protein